MYYEMISFIYFMTLTIVLMEMMLKFELDKNVKHSRYLSLWK